MTYCDKSVLKIYCDNSKCKKCNNMKEIKKYPLKEYEDYSQNIDLCLQAKNSREQINRYINSLLIKQKNEIMTDKKHCKLCKEIND